MGHELSSRPMMNYRRFWHLDVYLILLEQTSSSTFSTSTNLHLNLKRQAVHNA